MEPQSNATYCPICGRPVTPGVACNHGRTSGPPPLPGAVSQPNPASHGPIPGAAQTRTVPPPLPPQRPADLPPIPRRSIIEILLDPRSIQWLLASGGVLLVAGIVIWLASLGIFENPLVIASALGIGTLLLMLAGWWVVRRTTFHMAGQAVTLLACLVMPLNLWFYQSHQLLTLDGNLWMAAVVCCVLYAASALVLRDPLFAYVLCAGVAGTGLLILHDMGKFAEIASPSLMLTVMGLIAIHAERAFPVNGGPFARDRFGKAFFFSGHALLGGGLLLLLGAQITGWLLAPAFHSWDLPSSVVINDPSLRLLALFIVLAGTYGYIYSDLVVRKVGFYIYPAAFTLLWAEILGLQMLNLRYGAELIIAVLSSTALVLNVLYVILKQRQPTLTRGITPLAILLTTLPVIYGVLLHLRATEVSFNDFWGYEIGWGYVGAMVLTAITCRIGAHLYRRTDPTITGTYFFLTGAATLVGAAGLLNVLGVKAWSTQAPILMIIPILYLLASFIWKDQVVSNSLVNVAKTATMVMLISVLASATNLTQRVFDPVEGQPLNFMLAIFFAEGAIFYIIVSALRQQAFHVFLAAAMAGGAMWQLLSYYHTSAEVYMLIFAGLGLILLIGSRFLRDGMPARSVRSGGNALMTLSFLSSTLMVASRFMMRGAQSSDARLLGLMMLLMLIASVVVGSTGWRRGYIVMTIVNGALCALLLSALSQLTHWQKVELFCVVSGLLLLVLGHIGWFREQGRPDDTVSFNLLLGALLAGVPLLISAVVNRFGYTMSLPDEIALLTISILMLVSGVMLHLRATTITGGVLLALHLAMLLTFAGWKAQMALGVYLSIGGGLIFLLGLGLAIYREQLLALPDKIRKHEGVFKVLAWR